MHCPFWNTGISNSVTVRLFCHLFVHISFFDKDERQPHEFHIGCFFCITSMISKISIAYFFSLECQPLTWLLVLGPWKKLLNSSILIIEMWHRFITEVVHFSEVDTSLKCGSSLNKLRPCHISLTNFIRVDLMGIWSGGSWFHGKLMWWELTSWLISWAWTSVLFTLVVSLATHLIIQWIF